MRPAVLYGKIITKICRVGVGEYEASSSYVFQGFQVCFSLKNGYGLLFFLFERKMFHRNSNKQKKCVIKQKMKVSIFLFRAVEKFIQYTGRSIKTGPKTRFNSASFNKQNLENKFAL